MTLTITPINVGAATPTAPDVGLLTTQSLQGTGIFDILMKTVKLHLNEEYGANRITGKEYSNVYLGAISAVLQTSVSYLVNNTQVDKLNAEIGLIRQQTVTELTQTDNEIPLGLAFNGDTIVEGLVANQKALSASQISKTNKEMELADQQIVTELAQTDDHIPSGIGHNSSTTITGLIGSQKLHSDAEIKFTLQKTATELAQIVDTLPTGISNSPIVSITGLIKNQKDLTVSQIEKTTKEMAFISQQTATELAQIVDVLPAGVSLSSTTDVQGLVKNQKDLTASQIEKTTKEMELVDQQIVTELAQTGDTIPEGLGNNLTSSIAGMMKSVKDKNIAEIKLVNQKTASEIAQVADELPVGISNSPTLVITGLIKNQKDLAASQIKKTDGEVLLLGQKTITELAQTDSIIPSKVSNPGNTNPWLNSSTSISGALGTAKTLYTAQADGFKRDAEQKAAKIMADTWIAQRTTDEAIQANTTNHLHETDIGAVIQKLKAGIGA